MGGMRHFNRPETLNTDMHFEDIGVIERALILLLVLLLIYIITSD
jgi:hypothetical protein